MAHIKRDRKRRDKETTNEEYKVAIHRAVQESQGKDAYTDEPLDWTLWVRMTLVDTKVEVKY
jgi:hypothetical protein